MQSRCPLPCNIKPAPPSVPLEWPHRTTRSNREMHAEESKDWPRSVFQIALLVLLATPVDNILHSAA